MQLLNHVIPQSAKDRGILAALVGSLLISFDPVFIRYSGISGFDTAFLFGLFTAISMATVIQTTDSQGISKTLLQSGWPAILSGLLILGSATTFILSIKHTEVSNTMIILSGRPVVTALFSWLILKEKTSSTLWWATIGVIGGSTVVVYGSIGSPTFLGDGLALLTVAFLGLNGALLRRYAHISRVAIVGWAGFFMSITLFAFANPSSYTAHTWIIMGTMGLLTAPMGRVLNGISFRYIPAAEAALLSLIGTVLAPIWAYLFFKEIPTNTTILGGTIILATISVYLKWPKK